MYQLTAAGFVVITIVLYGLILNTLKQALKKTDWDVARRNNIFMRTIFAIAGWTIVVSALSLAGFFSDFSTFPPKFMLTLIVPLVTILFVTFSATMKTLLPLIPQKTIVGLQTFRVFVELLLWMLLIQNLAPIQMSFEGRNFDVLTGLTAPLAALFISQNKRALFVWNLLGMALLINILTIAVLSLPTPLRVFMNEPSNTIVAVFPFVLLPALLVPVAYGLHFFSLRKLALGSGER